MTNNELAFRNIAETLLSEYLCVYYVNAVTNEYIVYSADSWYSSLHDGSSGKDYFADVVKITEKIIYEEDKYIFLDKGLKDLLLSQVKNDAVHYTDYRLMIDGKPVYHRSKLIRGLGEDGCFILGVQNVDKEVRERQNAEKTEYEREIYDQIAGSLATHYDTLYYVNMETDQYFEYSSTDTYKKLNVPPEGDDFFTETAKNAKKYIHPDDQDRVLPLFVKQNMLSDLENTKSFSVVYRLVVNGETMYVRCSQIWASDRKHILVCIENINEEMRARAAYEETKRKSAAYRQVVKGLVSRYETVYYVNITNGEYSRYSSDLRVSNIDVPVPGKDFFAECIKLADRDLHPEDKDRILSIVDKDYMISALERAKQYSADYRRIIDGRTVYTRLKIMRSEDNVHFIVGLENINDEVKKEQEQIEALDRANELARHDSLTGARNATAYREFLDSIQKSIDRGAGHSPFAIVVCDVNGLKYINDYKGHSAGDEYIRSACRMICSAFSHSPVFRIGGDEFVAVLAGKDYDNRLSLVELAKSRSLENLRNGEGPVVAVGYAVFDEQKDHSVYDVFDRADEIMYEDKKELKSGKLPAETENPRNTEAQFPPERKRALDKLFKDMSVLAGEGCVYICDMEYDYSRWSKDLVDAYGLPSEYMYGAGKIWEEHIHPDDRESYAVSVGELFSGLSDRHDQQYRARTINGEYNVCSCSGIVLRKPNGEVTYFIGTIKDHSIQSETDSLTGLRNQYGFFADVRTNLIKNTEMWICLVGISRFSEINEIYGYETGNIVMQKFGRYLYDRSGSCSIYRLDGTKFAILTTTSAKEIIEQKYEALRARYRDGLDIDGRHIMLELNAGVIYVNDFNVDPQTVLACLNLAYAESKTRRHGDPVEFSHGLNDVNRLRLEKLHTIRASITKGYSGFYLLYQPVVDVGTEKTIGAEALLRWRNDEYGVVPPDLFIPLLEQDPLFPKLGEWILATAVKAAKQILEIEPSFVINVNLSYTQLEKPGFVDMVTGILEKTGYPAGHLCLEITERCRLLDLDLLKNIVVSLRGYGVQIALDDFGTGFSSIGIVKALPFNTIKIDRSFIETIEEDEKERALIGAFVDMATTYGAVVCIEGIETTGMRDILRGYDVHSFQGYYYAKPLEYEDFVKYISSR